MSPTETLAGALRALSPCGLRRPRPTRSTRLACAPDCRALHRDDCDVAPCRAVRGNTQLYNRLAEEISLDEIERIHI